MFKISGFFFIFIAVLCAILLFQTSQSVQTLEGELADILEVNQKEKDNIRVLTTEWDYLNSPENLEKFIEGGALEKIHSSSSGRQVFKTIDAGFKVIPPQKPSYVGYVEGEAR